MLTCLLPLVFLPLLFPFFFLVFFVHVLLLTVSWNIEEKLRASRVMAEAPRTGLYKSNGYEGEAPIVVVLVV